MEQPSIIEKTRLITYGIGTTGKRQVVAYDHDRLVTWGGLPGILARPSVFRLRFSLAQQFLVICTVAFLTYLVMARSISDSANTIAATGTDPRLYWKKQVAPIVQLATYANALVAFLLGLFISLSIQRWWVLRSVFIQGMVKASRNLVFSMAACLPGKEHDDVRQRIARYCLLSNRLLFMCARGDLCEHYLGFCVEEGLATKDEVDELLSALRCHEIAPPVAGALDCDVAEIPWLWNCRLVHILFKAGLFPPPVMALMHRLCIDARNAISGVEMQMNSQLPFAYCHLITTLVQGSVLLSSVKCGMLVSLATSPLAVACETTFHICLSMVYLGLLSMTAVIADPFGDDVIDFPAAQMQQQLWRGCCLIDAMRQLPEEKMADKANLDDDDDDGDGGDGGGDGGGDDGGDDGGE
jgi:predicted membrane chloride channel (bestrophin family)